MNNLKQTMLSSEISIHQDGKPENRMASAFTNLGRNSTLIPQVDPQVIMQRDMPVALFADFIESGTTGDIDVFLTRVCQMPHQS